jgi:O-antigen/teichoic acid export membrane protein
MATTGPGQQARQHGRDTDDGRDETHAEQVDRELMELLNELRVALPGVQFLFAFLLVVPFQQATDRATDLQRDVYLVTLVAAVVATALLIAPAAQHRALFRQHDKEALLRRSNRLAFSGLCVLAVAIVSAVLLVVDFLFPLPLALVTAGLVAVLLGWLWIGSPLAQRARGSASGE